MTLTIPAHAKVRGAVQWRSNGSREERGEERGERRGETPGRSSSSSDAASYLSPLNLCSVLLFIAWCADQGISIFPSAGF